jgi:hypothetical protein
VCESECHQHSDEDTHTHRRDVLGVSGIHIF